MNKILCLSIFTALLIGTEAIAQEKGWIKDETRHCQYYFSEYATFQSFKIIKGDCDKGYLDGDVNINVFLKSTSHNDREEIFTYQGGMKQGREHGQGIRVWSDGDQYEGQWRNGDFHGNGTFVTDKFKYTGEFRNGQYHGHGVEVKISSSTHDGSTYEGEFERGYYHGDGTLTFRDGTVVTGKWSGGDTEGESTVTFPDGSVYVGYCDRWGVLDGQGILTLPNGEKIEQEYDEGELVESNHFWKIGFVVMILILVWYIRSKNR